MPKVGSKPEVKRETKQYTQNKKGKEGERKLVSLF
jgi:hypothetical protein